MNLGTMRVLGHADFYPNGGGRQPECILDPLDPSLDPIREGLEYPSPMASKLQSKMKILRGNRGCMVIICNPFHQNI